MAGLESPHRQATTLSVADQWLQRADAVVAVGVVFFRLLGQAVVEGGHPFALAHGVFDNIRVRSDFNPADGDIADPLEDALVYTSADTLYVRWRAGTPPQAVAYPVRSIRFEYFAADNTPIVTPALIPSAAKAKYTITAPRKPGDVVLTCGAGSISAVSHALPGKLGAIVARRQA